MQQQRVVKLQRLLKEVREQIEAMLNEKPDESKDTATVQTMVLSQRFHYIQHLKQQAAHIQTSSLKEEALLNKIREEMRLAHVKKRSLELLAEKQKDTYLKALELHETNEMEDIVLGRMHHSRQAV